MKAFFNLSLTALIALTKADQVQNNGVNGSKEGFGDKAPKDVRGGASLQVIQPQELADAIGENGFMQVSLGNFGNIQYGTSITAPVFRPKGNLRGCEPFKHQFPNNAMVLVDAGGCVLTTKVRNIEQAGGMVALIGDALQDDPQDIFMEDVDGSGFSLHIPALMIDSFASDEIINSIDQGNYPTFKANIEISWADEHIVEVGLWYGSILDIPEQLIKSLYNYQVAMQNFVKFTPHIVTLQCPDCVFKVKDKECLSSGLYCLMPPKSEVYRNYNVTNAALLTENLFGRCLHEMIQYTDKDLLKWFNYMFNVRKFCFHREHKAFFEDEHAITREQILHCVREQIDNVGEDPRSVDNCVDTSFQKVGQNHTDNYLLNGDKLLAEIYGVSLHPAITINGQIYKGDLNGADIFRAICASFNGDYKPYECLQEFDITKELGHASEDFVGPHSARRERMILIGACIFVVLVNLGFYWMYKRQQDKEKKKVVIDEVSEHVGKYFALQEQNTSANVNQIEED